MHQIKQLSSGKWALMTHYGYVLFTADTREEVEKYYQWHCPSDAGKKIERFANE